MTLYTRWYRTGTVKVDKGSAAVTGTNTYWLDGSINSGDIFSIDGITDYEIFAVTDNTHITLKSAYQGASATGSAYHIIRNFTASSSARLAALCSELYHDLAQYWEQDTQTIHGKSAYEIAVKNGFTGTEAEWLDYLHDGAGLQALSARVDGLSDVMTVKKLRVGRLYTPFSVLNSYYNVEPNHLKDGTKSLFLTFLTSYKNIAHYHYNLRVYLHDSWGLDNRLSQKTLEYKATSSGYYLQIVQSLSDDSPAITVEDNCVYLTPGNNGTGHTVYAYADVEQLSEAFMSTERSGLFYTVNEELFSEITEYRWN